MKKEPPEKGFLQCLFPCDIIFAEGLPLGGLVTPVKGGDVL
jgi:hypothetical protein